MPAGRFDEEIGMDFYAVASGGIPAADLALFERISAVVHALPNLTFDPADRRIGACKNQLCCHLICRALASEFPVAVHDGYFTRGYQHSWLVPRGSQSIIDAYPIAGAAPFIVSGEYCSPWSTLYKPSTVFSGKFEVPEFRQRLEEAKRAVHETVQKLF